MRPKQLIFIILFFFLCSEGIALDGLEIMKRAYYAYRNGMEGKTEIEKIKVELIDISRGARRHRIIVRKIFYKEIGKDRALFITLAPECLKGTTLLVFRAGFQKGSQRLDQMWLWLPEWRKYFQLALQEKTYFVGLPLSYPDLSQLMGEDWWNYKYKVLDENEKYWILKALPKRGTLTDYNFRLIYIRKDNLFPEKYEYHKKNGGKKELVCKKIVKYSQTWRADRIEVREWNGEGKAAAFIGKFQVIKREIRNDISERYFSLKTLERQQW
ncbi:outer membrane lipoprotein-sorting protein [bacterium]|nr:outer membrane lipoprotein-sorting protein [bacterium]